MLKTVQTENGLVKGLSGNNARISVFKGIPFAAPPIGENRWKKPQPCKNWEGVLNAFQFGPISIQDTPGLGTDIYCREWHVDSEIDMDEDCLYLNVWTPAKKTTDKLPVLVWFFGGGFQWGYTPEMEFNGEQIAKRGVIVVSINYRLGAFGFLTHPELSKDEENGTSNFGLLDQLAGLKWVNRNIGAFGGDSSNITIAGQSAGGVSVLSHIASKQSAGYFQKAAIFSAMFRNPYFEDTFITPKTIENAESNGKDFFEFLGVSSLNEARKLDAIYIRDQYAKFAEKHPRFSPVIDHNFLELDPYKSFVNKKGSTVPLLTGNTTDEFLSFMPASSKEEFEEKIIARFGKEYGEKFFEFEEANVSSEFGYAPCRGIELSSKYGCAQNGADSYYYSFDADIPGDDHPGTFHSVDLWFFFETLAACNRPYDGHHYDLARMMCNYFTNFIKSGNPNGTDVNGVEMPLWQPYTNENKNEMLFTKDGCITTKQNSTYKDFLMDRIADLTQVLKSEEIIAPVIKEDISIDKLANANRPHNESQEKNETSLNNLKKKQAFNPYLPSWEYIPDGEPYVFGDRVYVYGSHDIANGYAFCLDDYVCWSAPVDDLTNWRYEGITFKRIDDPLNTKENKMCLYAPDVTQGPDGRYYLFYVLDKISIVSVAVCDTPAGKYEFLGYVHYPDGTKLGDKEGDEPQFDPGVITIGDKTYLYTGFCGHGDKSRSGAMVTVLDKDMLTVLEGPKIIVPGGCYSDGTEYEGHGFFEAPSIREFDGIYYFIYSSQVMHELCYATSASPLGPFKYGGVLVSNADLHIDTYKKADKPAAYGGNNHGSLIEIAGKRYIFYHRQTNNTWYSRQGCAEEIKFLEDGSIVQSEITSCGLNGGPLNDIDEYPAYIACNLFNDDEETYVGGHHVSRITQEGKDGDEIPGHIASIVDGANIGFKYFDCKNVTGIALFVRGYASGCFEVRTKLDEAPLASIKVEFSTVWETYEAKCNIPDGVNALYLKYVGDGTAELSGFKFKH